MVINGNNSTIGISNDDYCLHYCYRMVESYDTATKRATMGKLSLVDLAGTQNNKFRNILPINVKE